MLGCYSRRVSVTERVTRAAWGAVAALLLLMATAGAASAAGVHVGSEAEVIADGGANLREQPSLGASVVTLVGEARYVFVEAGPEGDWYRVEYNGSVGWLHGSLLGPARPRTSSRGDAVGRRSDERPPSGAPSGVRVGAEARVAVAEGVNLRREPSTAAGVAELVRNTRIVFVREGPHRTDEGAWYQVEFDGTVGWVMGSFLGPRARAAAEAAEPKPESAAARAESAAARAEAASAKPAVAPAKAEAPAAKAEAAQPRAEAAPAKAETAPAKAEAAPAKAEAPPAKAAAAPAKAEAAPAKAALPLLHRHRTGPPRPCVPAQPRARRQRCGPLHQLWSGVLK